MEKKRVKVIAVNSGKYDVDSIVVKINDKVTEICFDKKQEVTKYLDKEIFLTYKDGKFIIENAK